jgi:hypothetical protein
LHNKLLVTKRDLNKLEKKKMKPKKIKEIKKEKIVYELSENQFKQLVKTLRGDLRNNLWKLYYLRQITQKERQYLEFEFDKVIYGINERR